MLRFLYIMSIQCVHYIRGELQQAADDNNFILN